MTQDTGHSQFAEELALLSMKCYSMAAQKGFWNALGGPDEFTAVQKAQKIALIHSELSEALEATRKPGLSEKIPDFTAEEEEMADAFIRLLDYSAGFNLRLAAAVEAKMRYNATRPPKHGKLF